MSDRSRVRLISPVLWAFVCALMLRIALPAGTMVSAASEGGPVITLCSGSGVYEAVLDKDGRLTPVDHKHKPLPAHEHGACPFAGGHAWVPPSDPAPVRTAELVRLRRETPPPAAPRGTLRLRAPPPPSHAPPAFA